MSAPEEDTPGQALESRHAGSALEGRTPPSLLRSVRGAVGLGVTWGGLWAGFGAATSAVKALVFGLPASFILWEASSWGLVGAFSGALFAGFLALVQRRKVLRELNSTNLALQVGGAAFGLWMIFFLVTGLLPLLGVPTAALRALEAALFAGVSTWGTVEVARRAGSSPEELEG